MSLLKLVSRWIIRALILLCLGFSLRPVQALAADYAFVSTVFSTYDYISASTGGTQFVLGDDAVSAAVDLGFTFNYYNNAYTQIIIGSNGTIGFPTDTTSLDTTLHLPAIPDPAAPNAVIAPLSSNLDPSKGGSIYTLAGGVEGSRYFVVEWIGVPVAGGGGTRSFEMILYQDNSDIMFQYKTLRGGEAMDAATATVGIENQDGSSGLTLDPSVLQEGKSVLFSITNPDGDGDGMIDRFETLYSLDPSTDDGAGDKDTDGLSNLAEFNAGSNPGQTDTDGDGIPDGKDAAPKEEDADSDGIRDANEDLNKDGVLDAGETSPSMVDTDGDGYNDAVEITYQSDPRDPSSVPGLSGYVKVTGSIQAAIDAASSGALLYIPSGTYTEDLVMNKTITLIGADPDSTFLKGGITIIGVDGVTLTGFTIQTQNTDPAVKISGDASSATGAVLVNMTLKDCVNGILVSDSAGSGGASGAATKVTLDQVRFNVTQPGVLGYGIQVEGLQDASDQVAIKNSTISLTGGTGAVAILQSKNVTVTGNTVSNAQAAGILITDGTDVTVDNNAIQSNFGYGVQVGGSSTAVTLDRNTISGNGASGINLTGTASVTITDNAITSNKAYGILSDSTGTITNSGNYLSANSSGSYSGVSNTSETPASVVGATSAGKLTAEAAAWIRPDTGGTVAVLDPPYVFNDQITSIFGASVTFGSGVLSTDTLITISTSTETLPSLPVSNIFALMMPVMDISGSLTGQATITMPVLASYSTENARVFQLVNGTWEEITSLTTSNYGKTFLHQQVSFTAGSLGTFVLVIDPPVIDPGDTGGGGGGGCGLRRPQAWFSQGGGSADPLLFLPPVVLLIISRLRRRSAKT
ncbi:MAG: right-handed parallel beta-helix repeat-containing protein [bacterium]